MQHLKIFVYNISVHIIHIQHSKEFFIYILFKISRCYIEKNVVLNTHEDHESVSNGETRLIEMRGNFLRVKLRRRNLAMLRHKFLLLVIFSLISLQLIKTHNSTPSMHVHISTSHRSCFFKQSAACELGAGQINSRIQVSPIGKRST